MTVQCISSVGFLGVSQGMHFRYLGDIVRLKNAGIGELGAQKGLERTRNVASLMYAHYGCVGAIPT